MNRGLSRALAAAVLIGGAGAAGAQAQGAGAAGSAAQPPKEVPATIDPSKVKAKDNTENFLLPVPSEIVARLQRTPYGKSLSATVDIRTRSYGKLAPWQQSLALGMALSDVVLALEASPKSRILIGLDNVVAGMKALGFPGPKTDEVAELRTQYAADKLTKQQLVARFDALRADLLSLGKLLLGSQNYGLLIVGAWSSGAHATAVIARNEPRALEDLEVLKVRKVIETFIRLVGAKQEVAPVVASLNRLLPIATAGRAQPPTAKEAVVIESATAEILSLIPA